MVAGVSCSATPLVFLETIFQQCLMETSKEMAEKDQNHTMENVYRV